MPQPAPAPPPQAAPADRQRLLTRAAPLVPQLGGGVGEARLVCERQGGEIAMTRTDQGEISHDCWFDGVLLWLAVEDHGVLRAITAFFEGANIDDNVADTTSNWGEPEVSLSSDNVRVYAWRMPDRVFALRMVRRGVMCTIVAAPMQSEATATSTESQPVEPEGTQFF